MRSDFLMELHPSEQNDWIEKAAAAARGHTPARGGGSGNVLSPPSVVQPSRAAKGAEARKV